MSYNTDSYMLVGFPYEDKNLIERSVEWCKENLKGFKEEYKKQVEVVELMPRYKSDLKKFEENALNAFYDHLGNKNIVRIKEHCGLSYIGFPVSSSISINDKVLEEFCQTVKQKSDELYELLGKKGCLISTHDYS